MRVIPTDIADVVIVEPRRFGDHRGCFFESWSQQAFAEHGIHANFVQDNHSRSAQGVLRGLHYQLWHPQGKLVRVTAGEVFDVAVDLRRTAPSFGRWIGVTLSADNARLLWIPPGFAHGFFVTSAEGAECQYKCTDRYAPDYERSLRWDDPEIGISWPLIDGQPPTLAAKDAAGALLRDAEVYP
ncbi:MAG: dTDP-4-dehydrorhamnose 3,5-epimerase [Pseudomonadales bacterium]